jgi:hypothetical protein
MRCAGPEAVDLIKPLAVVACALGLLATGCFTTSVVRAQDIVAYAAGKPVPAFDEHGPKRALRVGGGDEAVLIELDDAASVEPVLLESPAAGAPVSRVVAPLEISVTPGGGESGPRRVLVRGRNGQLEIELAALRSLRVEEYSPGETAGLVVPLALLGTAGIAALIALGVAVSGLGQIR